MSLRVVQTSTEVKSVGKRFSRPTGTWSSAPLAHCWRSSENSLGKSAERPSIWEYSTWRCSPPAIAILEPDDCSSSEIRSGSPLSQTDLTTPPPDSSDRIRRYFHALPRQWDASTEKNASLGWLREPKRGDSSGSVGMMELRQPEHP